MLKDIIENDNLIAKETDYRNFLIELGKFIKFVPGTSVTVSNPQKNVVVDNLPDLIKAVVDKSNFSVDNFPTSFEVSNLEALQSEVKSLNEPLLQLLEMVSKIKLEVPQTQIVTGDVTIDQSSVIKGLLEMSQKIDSLNSSIQALEMSPMINVTPQIQSPDFKPLEAEIAKITAILSEKPEEVEPVEMEEPKIVSLSMEKDKYGNVRKITEVYDNGETIITDGLNMDKIQFDYGK